MWGGWETLNIAVIVAATATVPICAVKHARRRRQKGVQSTLLAAIRRRRRLCALAAAAANQEHCCGSSHCTGLMAERLNYCQAI